jgi:hypothetical protein
MSKTNIRKDKTCLNCKHVVENKFCPNCGQKNEDTRKTFHHLFIHFFEDLTHYENAFWKTIRDLLVKPGSLTCEYLSGKRLTYLAPVKLYIFISFVTFLLLTMFPNETENNIKIDPKTESTKDNIAIDSLKSKEAKIKTLLVKKSITKTESDTLLKNIEEHKEEIVDANFLDFGYNSVKQIDSIQKYGSKKEKLSDFQYWINKKFQLVKDKNNKDEIVEKFKESFIHNIPKVLFIYMPLFAFVLWLFHNKKKWYYFDHGIFTLHYFSFLLLIILIQFLFNKAFLIFPKSTLVDLISGIINLILISWMLYYFFPAHRRFYKESKIISVVKTGFIFFINIFIITVILTLFAFYTFITID